LVQATLAQGTPGCDFRLGAVTHFSQGWPTSIIPHAVELGVTHIRDSIPWSRIETTPGVYDFSDPNVAYVDELIAAGLDVTLVFAGRNPLYDNNGTPSSEVGRAAFAAFIVAALERFQDVKTIEIGNEFNGDNFVFGTVLEAPYADRATHYTALLKSVHDAVRAQYPDVKILGGATHSIPVDYLAAGFALGALDAMDGIAVHPYTTAPELLASQFEALSLAANGGRPIYVTEFGVEGGTPEQSAIALLKYVSAFAASGVCDADWYALMRQQGFENMELMTRSGELTPAGQAFALLTRDVLPAGRAADIAPDPFVSAYLFGTGTLVMWGEPRTVQFSSEVEVLDVDGSRSPATSVEIGPDMPVVIKSSSDLSAAGAIDFGVVPLVADSLRQFTTVSGKNVWRYSAIKPTGPVTLAQMGGGSRKSELWTPYMGDKNLRPLSISGLAASPTSFKHSDGTYETVAVEEAIALPAGTYRLVGDWDTADKSSDGVTLTVALAGAELYAGPVGTKDNGYTLNLDLPFEAADGALLSFTLHPNKNSEGGDGTRRRIRIFTAGSSQ
jgi:hypothetical protein